LVSRSNTPIGGLEEKWHNWYSTAVFLYITATIWGLWSDEEEEGAPEEGAPEEGAPATEEGGAPEKE